MHGEAAHWQKRIRRELGDPSLLVRWNEEIERYQVGEVLRLGSADHKEWFYTVTDGNNGFRPLDDRTVRKIRALDKANQVELTGEDIRKMRADAKQEREAKAFDDRRHQLREELRTHRRARYTRKLRDM